MKIDEITDWNKLTGLDVVIQDVNGKAVAEVKVQDYGENDATIATVICAILFEDGTTAKDVEVWKKPFKGAADSIFVKNKDAKGNTTFVPNSAIVTKELPVRFIQISTGPSSFTNKPAGGAKTLSAVGEKAA